MQTEKKHEVCEEGEPSRPLDAITILRECHQTGILKLLNPKKNLHLINFLLTVHSYEN